MSRPLSWLVTGARGQLGRDLVAVLAATRPGEAVTALGRAELDLADQQQVRTAVRDWLARSAGTRPVVLNAAAYTAVDAAETDEATALRINGEAPGWLAQELAEAPGGPARLVHVSTDYVFDGSATTPYPVDAPVAPRSAYGRTKAAGERAVAAAGGDAVTVRTAWVWSRHGTNFVTTMTRLATERDTVAVVTDQVGAPTLSADLAAALVALAAHPGRVPPLLHFTDAGQTSWHGLARAVFTAIGADPDRVLPTTTAGFPRPAPRPAYSVLDLTAWTDAGLPAPRPWQAALAAAFAGDGAPQSSQPPR